ncbi:hypothetical protein PybrP1_001055 [[Pythium] brassicae (nom. inval.)]|nr:hypothetical protein PybrP1_001055 [[Pythium] brassicae (nom. inval.)]
MATPHSLCRDPRASCRASSVLDRNKSLYGAANALSTDPTSCWTSAQGSPQHLLLLFQRRVTTKKLSLMFQGGFVGQDIQVLTRDAESGQWRAEAGCVIEPVDSNELQEFPCTTQGVDAMRIIFQRSTDFYGRVVVYGVDVLGCEGETEAEPHQSPSS